VEGWECAEEEEEEFGFEFGKLGFEVDDDDDDDDEREGSRAVIDIQARGSMSRSRSWMDELVDGPWRVGSIVKSRLLRLIFISW